MLEVRQTKLTIALELLSALPEFDTMKAESHYAQILHGKRKLILTAFENDLAVGCKLGYDRFEDGSFYSWLGGVLPAYRNKGVAKMLADHQEDWARENGFESIKFKTLNQHKAMLQFALRNGFDIYNVKPKEELKHFRIELVKQLS